MSSIQTSPLLDRLRSELRGEVIGPDDAAYDQARAVKLSSIDRRPQAIARVADAGDVACVVSLAREAGLELAVRSGAHSAAGHSTSEGGIVLDLSAMRGIEIDADERFAWAEAGLTTGEYTTAAAEHGLATGFGDAGTVGISGITLGGGVGFLSRKYGLTIDSLLAAELVTADGELLHVDSDSHPDLFWAIRGGGGNFGVVTRLKLRLHPVDEIVGGMLFLPATPEVVAGLVAEAEAAPEELSLIANVMPAPPMPFLPEEAHGKLVVMAMVAHIGDREEGERAMDRLRALAEPVVDMLRPMRYGELFAAEPEGPQPAVTFRNAFSEGIGLAEAEAIVEQLGKGPGIMAVTQIRVLGGAIAQVPDDATAYAHRGEKVMVQVVSMYAPGDDPAPHREWANALAERLARPGAGVYANFIGDEGEEGARASYPGSTWERLAQVKSEYDPGNLFRLNQNIVPA